MISVGSVRGSSHLEVELIKRKRILFVFAGSELGGAERQGLLLARFLKEERRADVEIWGLAAERPGKVAELCSEYGIVWRAVSFNWPFAGINLVREVVKFVRSLKADPLDIILAYTWLPNIVCGLAWKFSGAAYFVWNQRDEGLELKTSISHRLAVRLTPAFVANSIAGRDFLVNTYGIKPEDVSIIHNGVELPPPQEDRSAWRKRLGIGEDDFVACMVANLHSYKDHPTLLKAWRHVLDRCERGQRPILILAGRLDSRGEELRRLMDELGLVETVKFIGAVNDVSGLLHAVDLCVYSSVSEGSPNAVLEAMAAGLPVVATDIPGIRDAVGEEGLPFLTPPGDPHAMAERVQTLLTDKELRRHIGAIMRKRAVKEFTPSVMCNKYRNLLYAALQS